MRKGDRKPNMEKLAGIAKTLLDNRVFLIAVISACVVIMIISAASIVRSLVIMHENALWEAAAPVEADPAATVDPYFVPTPEPTPDPTPIPTPPPTTEPTPELPWGWKEYGGQTYYVLENNTLLTGLHLIGG